MPIEMRHRIFQVDGMKVRKVSGATVIEGHAALFNTLSAPLWELGGAREKIAPGAFTRAITDDDVRALVNHDPSLILGRNKAGTLTLKEDDKGLWYSVQLPSTSYARDLVESVRRGDINQNSFGFTVDDQAWEKQDGEDVSVVRSVHLFDVSPVTFPAYVETHAEVRSIVQALSRQDPTDADRKLVKEFMEKRCQPFCGSALLTNERGNGAEGRSSQRCGCQGHGTQEVDPALAREIRRRELELFEIEA